MPPYVSPNISFPLVLMMWRMSSHVVSSSSYLLHICSASLSDSSSFFSCCFSIYHLIFFTLARCCFLWCALNSTEATRTVVPVLGDPRRERPPAVYGHVVNVPTYFNVKLPLISGHLPNADADSHLLVSAPAITDSANKCHIVGGHFNQKSLAPTQTWDRQFAQISVLPSGDQQAICHVIETD